MMCIAAARQGLLNSCGIRMAWSCRTADFDVYTSVASDIAVSSLRTSGGRESSPVEPAPSSGWMTGL